MNKRTFKKYMQIELSEAIEAVLIKSANNDKGTELMNKKVDDLLNVYDTVFANINKENTLKTTKEKKAHFRAIVSDMQKEIEKIYSEK